MNKINSFINNRVEETIKALNSMQKTVSSLWRGFKVTLKGDEKIKIKPESHPSAKPLSISERHQVKKASAETELPVAIRSLRAETPPLPKTHVKNCAIRLPQGSIEQFATRLNPGGFIISESETGFWQFHYKDGRNNVRILPFQASEDGSITLENGKRFPSLAHLMAADQYRFLEVPIILNPATRIPDVGQMKLVFDQAWEITLDNKKVSPQDRVLISQLKALVEADSKEETKAALAKLNLKTYDAKSLLQKTESLPEPFKGIFNRSIFRYKLKSFGHEWGIGAQIIIGGQSISTEGFYRTDAHQRLAASVKEFLSAPLNYGSALSRLDAEFRQSMSETIINSLERAVDYARDDNDAAQLLADYQAKKPVTIGTGWHKHAVEVTLHDGYLFYTNRGLRLHGEALEDSNAKMKCFKIDSSKVTLELIQQIMASDDHDSPEAKNERMQWFEGGGGLHAALGVDAARPDGVVDKKEQKIGNCTWANCKGGFHAELIALLLIQNLKEKEKFLTFEAAFLAANTLGTEIFKEWEYGNRSKAVDDIIAMEEMTKKAGAELTPGTYYALLCELGAKVGRKGSDLTYVRLRPNPVIQALNKEMKTKLDRHMKNLDMKLEDCLFEADFANQMQLNIFMADSMPGDFLLAKNAKNEVMLHVKTGQGVQETESIALIPHGPGYLLGGTPVASLKDLYAARKELALPRMVQRAFTV